MKPIHAPVAAEVRQDQESEAFLIADTKASISRNNWKIGENAAKWTERWAKGRTDDDFGYAVGMTGDQVYQRRRVWERFGETDLSRNLSWTHFREALNWDDADACLQWAYENSATVSEMKAWKSAQSGETEIPIHIENSDPEGDPFEEAGKDGSGGEEDGQETGGTDSEEPPPPAGGSRQGRAGGDSEKPPKDEFATQKAKAVKTAEALMRAIDDLNDMAPVPNHDAINRSLGKVIITVKSCAKKDG